MNYRNGRILRPRRDGEEHEWPCGDDGGWRTGSSWIPDWNCERLECEIVRYQDNHREFCEHFYGEEAEWIAGWTDKGCAGAYTDHVYRECGDDVVYDDSDDEGSDDEENPCGEEDGDIPDWTCEKLECEIGRRQENHCMFCDHFSVDDGWEQGWTDQGCAGAYTDHIYRECGDDVEMTDCHGYGDDYESPWGESPCGAEDDDDWTCERAECELGHRQENHCTFCEHFPAEEDEWIAGWAELGCAGAHTDHIYRQCGADVDCQASNSVQAPTQAPTLAPAQGAAQANGASSILFFILMIISIFFKN